MGNQFEAERQSEVFQAASNEARAPDEVIQRFIGSYGVRTSLLQLFGPTEVAQAQVLNRRFYEKWIAEVQTSVRKLE